MMTHAQWRRAMFWGRLAYWIVLALPGRAIDTRIGMWFVRHAGFYAYGTTYDDYVWRAKNVWGLS
jgi:hypothetical protein